MKAHIAIAMDNDAFRMFPGRELASILRHLADCIEDEEEFCGVEITLRDENGNAVGSFSSDT